MARAWVYQDAQRQARRNAGLSTDAWEALDATARDGLVKTAAETAAWYVGWYEPGGKRCCKSAGPGSEGAKNAERLRRKLEAELVEGTYQRDKDRKQWDEFRDEYETRVVSAMDADSQRVVRDAMNQFAKLVKPVRMAGITTRTIDEFRARRRACRGKKRGTKVSPATVNKDLRNLRAALRKAHKWGYLATLPDVTFEKEPGKLVVYVTPEHFAAIYAACDKAKRPCDQPFSAGDWWRGLLIMEYMTGWRIGALLALRREDVDLEAGTAITRACDNKGKRAQRISLHPLVIEHLKRLPSFSARVFPWAQSCKSLNSQFAALQEAAGIHLLCHEDREHKHTRFCHVYGFHDVRRAFATMNAERLGADALQTLMQHKSYQTTKRYISMATRLDKAVGALYVPTLPAAAV